MGTSTILLNRRYRLARIQRLRQQMGGHAPLQQVAPFPTMDKAAGDIVWSVETAGSGFRFSSPRGNVAWSSDTSFDSCRSELFTNGRLLLDWGGHSLLDALKDRLLDDDEPLDEIYLVAPKWVVAPALVPQWILHRQARVQTIDVSGPRLELCGPAQGIGAVHGDFSRVIHLTIRNHVWLWTSTRWNESLQLESHNVVKLWRWNAAFGMWKFEMKGG